MSNLTDAQMAEAFDLYGKQTSVDDHIREILIKYLEIEENKAKENAGYVAWAGYALATGLTLANMLLALKRPDSGRSTRAIADITYVLNTNEFWTRNSGFLMPLVILSVNAQKDYVLLASEYRDNQQYATHDRVLRGVEAMGLEIFTAILYLVGGPELMAKSSMGLRMELAPYFIR